MEQRKIKRLERLVIRKRELDVREKGGKTGNGETF